MPTFREALLVTVNNLRYLPSLSFDIRTFRVYLVTRTWSGGSPNMGDMTDTIVEILPRPKVREQADGASIIVGPITPSNVAGGYTPSQLFPADSSTTEFFWRVDGPFANGQTSVKYKPVHIDTSKAFSYTVTCESLEKARPF